MKYTNIKSELNTVAVSMLLGFSVFTTSCESNVLDLSPQNGMTEIEAYSTPERCELAVLGAYDAAQCGYYEDGADWTRGYPFGAASIIQGEMRGEDMNLTAVFYDYTYSATYTTATGNNKSMWETSFEAINRYNIVMAGVEEAAKNGVITEEVKKQYLGECLFLRALTYHNLMVHYALPYNVEGNNNYGMPLYLKAVTDAKSMEEQLKIGRSSVADTYSRIITDLNDAEGYLPTAIKGYAICRATKGAAIALKTRVYLHMRDWSNVVTEAEKLISGEYKDLYKLEKDPATPFTSFSNNNESIFSIANSSSDNGSVNGAMSSMMSPRAGGRAICTSSPTLYNSTYWEEDDKRRKLLYYRESDQYYFCDKYQSPTSMNEYAPIIRYAEVLLNEAEALARQDGDANNKNKAIAKLNEVRNRSLADATTQAYKAENFTDTKALVEAILWERRIEFHGEGRRWEDIHRLAADDLCPSGGIPAKISYDEAKGKGVFVIDGTIDEKYFGVSAIPYTDKRFLWPIPINDLVRNETLAKQQNAGW